MAKHEHDDHVAFRLVADPTMKCGKSIQVDTPSGCLRIKSKEELKAQLDHYANPLLKMTLPDSKFARLHYVEKIRPALRFYCKKFGVTVPHWLQADSFYTDKPVEEKMDLFGTDKLHIVEFSKIVSPEGGEVER